MCILNNVLSHLSSLYSINKALIPSLCRSAHKYLLWVQMSLDEENVLCYHYSFHPPEPLFPLFQ